MSEMSKKARADMRAKATRMANGTDPHRKVDASSWQPEEPLNAGRKTGARPVRPRIYKNPGGPVALQNDRKRADRKPRASGGATSNYPGAESTIDTAGANKREFGSFHDGGYKRGGKARKHRDSGGHAEDVGTVRADADAKSIAQGEKDFGRNNSNIRNAVGTRNPEPTVGPLIKIYGKGGRAAHKDGGKAAYTGGTRPTGGRIVKATGGERDPRKSGGRAKGKTNINIVIAQPKEQGNPMQQMPQGPIRPMPPPMPPAMGGPSGPMPGGRPPGMPPGGPPMPMPRKSGGRAEYPSMKFGSGSGLGRMEKIEIQKRSGRNAGGGLHLSGGAGGARARLEKAGYQKHHE